VRLHSIPFYRSRMRHNTIVLIAIFSASLFGADALLSPKFRTVYITEMPNSLNQHLASRLTKLARERCGWSSSRRVPTRFLPTRWVFWNWLAHTYPLPAAAAGSNGDRDASYRPDAISSSRQRGTVFLVDPRSRLVLWSTYDLPKSGTPAELDRTAMRITNQLKVAFGRK
jgi:hypothetical protein